MHRGATVLVPQVNGFGHNGIRVLLWNIAQEVNHTLWPVDAHQHDLVAEKDLHGDKHQDLTGATDHLVPHPLQARLR